MKTVSLQIGFLTLALASANAVCAGERYNELEDAAVAQAKVWQAGGKAKPIRSSDGKIIFPFGEYMPTLTCSPGRACDVEMEPGEKIKDVVLGDSINWTWNGTESVENGKPVQHVVIQPKDVAVETNAIIPTNRRTYHIRLYAPKVEGAYLNRIGFYYPGALVASWASKMGEEAAAVEKDEAFKVTPAPVAPESLAFDYRIDGNADFKPVRVFNNGEKVWLSMPDEMKHGENPTLSLVDESGNLQVVNYRRKVDPATGNIHYEVDRLFNKAVLQRGEEKVTISWKRKEKGFWASFGRRD